MSRDYRFDRWGFFSSHSRQRPSPTTGRFNAPGRRLRAEPLEDRCLLSITVDTFVDEADGSIVDGDVSLRDAIALAPIGETIDFSVAGTIDLVLGELVIDRDLTIDGPSAGLLTIDAGGNSRIFNVDDGSAANDSDVTIARLTLTGGHAAGHGGAIRSLESLTLISAVVTGNRAANGADGGSGNPGGGGFSGGGIWTAKADLTVITDSTISGNRAGNGGQGGAYGGSGGVGGAGGNGGGVAILENAVITDSIISDNTAGQGGLSVYSNYGADGGSGGGVWISGNLDVSGSSISGNISGAGGGSYFYDGGSPGSSGPGGGIAGSGNLIVRNSTVSGNSVGAPGHNQAPGNYNSDGRAGAGGGIHTIAGTLEIIRSTIADNAAGDGGDGQGIRSRGNPGGSGGGIYARDTSVTVTESTVSGNRAGDGGFSPKTFNDGAAAGDGGGIWSNAATTIVNSTLSGNTTGMGGSVGEYSSGASGGDGGGLFVAATTSISHSTITDNTTGRGGMAYGNYEDDGRGAGVYGDVTLDHTIVADNNRPTDGPSDVWGTFQAGSTYNLIGVDDGLAGISDGVDGNQIGTLAAPVDPRLRALADNGGPTFTHAFFTKSPAVDAGDPAFGPPPLTDQRGYYRVIAFFGDEIPHIDIGAFEDDSVAPLPGDGNLDGTVDGIDYVIWAIHFGDDPALDPPGSPANGDYNLDGSVDELDYLVWAINFGASIASQSAVQDAAIADETSPLAPAETSLALVLRDAESTTDDAAVDVAAVDAVFDGPSVKKKRARRR